MTGPDTRALEAIPRRAARVILLDAAGRVLLMHGADPARPQHAYWFTPGAGLDPGETPAEFAARELYEETGLSLPPGNPRGDQWRDGSAFPLTRRQYRQTKDLLAGPPDTCRPRRG